MPNKNGNWRRNRRVALFHFSTHIHTYSHVHWPGLTSEGNSLAVCFICQCLWNENAFGLNIYAQTSVFVWASRRPYARVLVSASNFAIFRSQFSFPLDICEWASTPPACQLAVSVIRLHLARNTCTAFSSVSATTGGPLIYNAKFRRPWKTFCPGK